MTDGATATRTHDSDQAEPAAELPRGPRTGVEIHVSPAATSALVRDYFAASPALAGFFAAHPSDGEAFRAKAEAVRARLTPERRNALRPALRPTNEAARAKLTRILDGEGVFVTTGQQAGLFGGPTYTITKILSAVRLAEALEELLQQPCMAVFWVASDDHDWDEANHTFVLDAEQRVHRITLAAAADAPDLPMSERVLGEQVEDALAAFIERLPPSEFAPSIDVLLRSTYKPRSTVAQAFGDLLHGFFHDTELAFIDPASPELKAAAAPLMAYELKNATQHARLLARQSERLIEAGYHAQVAVAEDAANVFFHDPLGRERLVRDDDGWALRRTRRIIPDTELHAMLDADPTKFSPNVFLRPVIESAVLPTVAYVGGPAEVSYFAQIGCLFHAHGIEPPIVVPRFGLTVVEGKVRKVLDKFGLTIADVGAPFHELVTRIVRERLPDDVTAPLAALREAVMREFARLARGGEAIDPTLRGWLTGQRNTFLGQLEAAEKKITSHRRKRSDIEIEQLRRAASNLQPEGTHQERALNALPLVARYGPGILSDIAEAMTYWLHGKTPGGWGLRCD
jgi:bacillithiol biosynthesis cysteine-adding enzyme BshC